MDIARWLFGATCLATFQTGNVPPDGRPPRDDVPLQAKGTADLTIGAFRDQKGYFLCDALAEGRSAAAVKLLRELLAQDEPTQVILSTIAGRGSPDLPGLVLGLDRGGACTGAAFRIAEEGLEEELRLLWRREMLSRQEGRRTAILLAASLIMRQGARCWIRPGTPACPCQSRGPSLAG